MLIQPKKLDIGMSTSGTHTTNTQTRCRDRLFFIKDRATGVEYLIDTGASMSVVPPIKEDLPNKTSSNLLAANDTPIHVYGERLISVNLGLRRNFVWTFTIADVNKAIIGLDFLSHYGLNVDVRDKCLRDSITGLIAHFRPGDFSNYSKLSNFHSSTPYAALLDKFSNLTSNSPTVLKEPSIPVKHYISTTGNPCHYKARPIAHKHQQAVRDTLDSMLQEGTIRPSRSNWASPIHIVPKKDGTWRIVGDYRYLNSVTKPDTYSLPYLQDFTANLHGMKIFSRVDLKGAFLQVPINEEDIPKTAIATPLGNFEFLRMNFGLQGASQTFQRYINSVLWNLETLTDKPRRVNYFVYIDDILIASENESDHMQDLEALFTRLSNNNLKINAVKCLFGTDSLEFLGHLVNTNGIMPLPDKIKAISEFSRPLKLNGLRRFVGMISYYRKFIPHASDKLSVLFDLITAHDNKKKNAKLNWTDQSIAAFESAKQLLASKTLLSHPIPDAELSIHCDASGIATGAVLQQSYQGNMQPIAFHSAKLSKAQQKYSTFGRELLAIYLALKHFRRYIEGREFIIFTDHKPIIAALLKPERDIARETRQLQFISEFSCKLQHISGSQNEVADTLSRSDDDQDTISSNITNNSSLEHSLLADIAHEQSTDTELTAILNSDKCSINLENVNGIYYERQGNLLKPYIPTSLRKRIFNEVHNTSHPGARATLNLLRNKFFWPGINKDSKAWSRSCIKCQQCKVTRHNSTPTQTIQPPEQKFDAINIDIVGPLPPSRNYTYLLTIVDRFSRWCEAIPLSDIKATTVCDALMHHWISRYGVPLTITSDRGSNFESHTFQSLVNQLGSIRIRTTAYHPQGNALVERFHRRLKEAIKATSTVTPNDWYNRLPLILLSLRTSLKENNQPSSSQILYGTNIRLPVDLLVKSEDQRHLDVSQYTDKLFSDMQNVGPIETKPHNTSHYMDKHLQTCKYVFIRNENKRGLQPAYSGPYLVLERQDTYFKVQLHNRQDNIHISRLKAAHTEDDVLQKNSEIQNPVFIPNSNTTQNTNNTSNAGTSNNNQSSQTNNTSNTNTSNNQRRPLQVKRKHVTINLKPQIQRSSRSGRVIKTPPRFR